MTSLNLATLTATSTGLTTATTAYTDGDTLGAIMSFNLGSAAAVIASAVLTDAANIIGAVDAYIFDRSVTLAADNAAHAISDADALFKLGQIAFYGATAETNNRAAHVDSLGIVVVPNAANTIYVALVTRSAHTFFGAVGNLQLRLSYYKDV